ncbi:DUF1868 domain-containing protein [Pacificibacter sp. AS14]|uniref:DUF1868 domain-containing protein n=1 Tax=Pacificibacter sp. AS14 TaxID=3135785 RepID=UPI0031808B41
MAAFRRDPFKYLTGQLENSVRPLSVTQPGLGGKFTPDGRVQSFPGNTVICHLDPACPAYAALSDIHSALQSGPHAASFVFLPPSSFHMTVFGCLSGIDQFAALSRGKSGPDGSREAITHGLENKLTSASDWPTEFCVSARGLHGGYSITLEGCSEAEEAKLRRTRDQLANATDIKHPDHDRYTFHFSLAYLIEWLSPDAAKAVMSLSDRLFEEHSSALRNIHLGPMEFRDFDDMFAFRPVRLLDNTQPAHEVIGAK